MGLALVAAAIAGPASASSVDRLYERTLMIAANARCGLFAEPVAAALALGQSQARRDALLAGAAPSQLSAAESRARLSAAGQSCSSAELRASAARVRQAHEHYARLERLTYPGDLAAWRADRGSGRRMRWRLSQTAAVGRHPVVFGLAGRQDSEALIAVAGFPNARRPYAARLVMRDVRRSSGPYLDLRGGRSGSPLPLARRLPPMGPVKGYAAEARSKAPKDLLPAGLKRGWAFRFPSEAVAAMAGLDPREAVAVEFLFAGAPDTVRVYVEVGDFAAGREFLTLAAR